MRRDEGAVRALTPALALLKRRAILLCCFWLGPAKGETSEERGQPTRRSPKCKYEDDDLTMVARDLEWVGGAQNNRDTLQ